MEIEEEKKRGGGNSEGEESGCAAVIERYPVAIASHGGGERIRVLKRREMSGADTRPKKSGGESWSSDSRPFPRGEFERTSRQNVSPPPISSPSLRGGKFEK